MLAQGKQVYTSTDRIILQREVNILNEKTNQVEELRAEVDHYKKAIAELYKHAYPDSTIVTKPNGSSINDEPLGVDVT